MARRTLLQFVRYTLAVVAGAITGEVLSIPIALLLDFVFGANATGGRWPLTTANVTLECVKGLATGYSASWIAGNRGKLIGALANFFLLFCIIVISLAINRDILYNYGDNYDTKPALWVWIGLLPAIVGGHLGVKFGTKGISYLAATLGFVGLWGSYVGGAVFHIYTINVAYGASGLAAAVIASGTPPFSEAYWFIEAWRLTGTVFNSYSIYAIALLASLLFGFLLLGASAWLDRSPSQTAMTTDAADG
jgi:hypothetical protein